jgi:hypothetical protein
MSVKRFLAAWLPLAIVVSALCATIYVVAQQSYRMGANDLPAQLAEDAAAAMGRGASVAAVVGSETVDIATSSAPFVAVFDGAGVLVDSSARLDGAAPSPPKGVLATARANGVNKVTWQPKTGMRMATVTVAVPGDGGNTVMAGRSLRETEAHVDQLGQLVALGWLGTLALSLAAVFAGMRFAGAAKNA